MNRGPDPEDPAMFGEAALPALRAATHELSWLRTRGYALDAAVALVGNRHQLRDRQRWAVRRGSCTDASLERRHRHRVTELGGEPVAIDGFNLLITIERAMSGGPVFVGRDGVIRDIAGVHGTWRAVSQTPGAIARVGEVLAGASATWLLDRPVSNSGRLAGMIRQIAEDAGWPWEARVVDRPDPVLATFDGVIATGDGPVLDLCRGWFDLTGAVLAGLPHAWVVDLRGSG